MLNQTGPRPARSVPIQDVISARPASSPIISAQPGDPDRAVPLSPNPPLDPPPDPVSQRLAHDLALVGTALPFIKKNRVPLRHVNKTARKAKELFNTFANMGVDDSDPERSNTRALNASMVLMVGVSIISLSGWWSTAWYFHLPLSVIDFGVLSLFMAVVYVMLLSFNGLGFRDFVRCGAVAATTFQFFFSNALMPNSADSLVWMVAITSLPVLVFADHERRWVVATYLSYIVVVIFTEYWKMHYPITDVPVEGALAARYCNIVVLSIGMALLLRYYRNAAATAQLEREELLKDLFGKFVDPRIVTDLVGSGAAQLGRADRRVVTVFFSDIRGFTAISEQLTAVTMVTLLNHYFDAVTRCIRAENGLIDKYIGDSVMAFWSSPFSSGDSHAAAACLAALAQQDAIEALQVGLPDIVGLRRNAPELFVRMGIATGEVVVGTVGSSVSMNFTVIGDTVNLASRLEAVNKEYGTRVIIADDTLRLAQNEIEARELDLITVSGRNEPVRIHELLSGFGELSAADVERREEFAAGLAAYRSRSWDKAQAHFGECVRLDPNDRPAAVFLDRIDRFRVDPPLETWDGVWRFSQK